MCQFADTGKALVGIRFGYRQIGRIRAAAKSFASGMSENPLRPCDSRSLRDINAEQDLFVEVNHGPLVVDNNLFFSNMSIWTMSQGGAFENRVEDNQLVPAVFFCVGTEMTGSFVSNRTERRGSVARSSPRRAWGRHRSPAWTTATTMAASYASTATISVSPVTKGRRFPARSVNSHRRTAAWSSTASQPLPRSTRLPMKTTRSAHRLPASWRVSPLPRSRTA